MPSLKSNRKSASLRRTTPPQIQPHPRHSHLPGVIVFLGIGSCVILLSILMGVALAENMNAWRTQDASAATTTSLSTEAPIIHPDVRTALSASNTNAEIDFTNWNQEPAAFRISQQLNGARFDVPYHPNWGNEEYFLRPIEANASGTLAGFGPYRVISNGQDVRLMRAYALRITSPRTRVAALAEATKATPQAKLIKIGSYHAVRTPTPNGVTLEIMGHAHNYIFMMQSAEDETELQNVISTATLP